MRNADPKRVQDKVASQAKEAQTTVQSKVNEVLGSLDTDLKKLGETAQDLALRSVGVAAEYAVKARETYEKVAERGEQSVRSWRGDAADGVAEIAVAVEPRSGAKQATRPAAAKPAAAKPAAAKPAAAKTAPAKASVKNETKAKPEAKAAGAKPAARKTGAGSGTTANAAVRKPAAPAKKPTPPASK